MGLEVDLRHAIGRNEFLLLYQPAGLSDGHEDSTIVRTLVGLGHNLGLETIAEGIEHSAQLEELRQHRCRYGQVFLFACPVVPKEVERRERERLPGVTAPVG